METRACGPWFVPVLLISHPRWWQSDARANPHPCNLHWTQPATRCPCWVPIVGSSSELKWHQESGSKRACRRNSFHRKTHAHRVQEQVGQHQRQHDSADPCWCGALLLGGASRQPHPNVSPSPLCRQAPDCRATDRQDHAWAWFRPHACTNTWGRPHKTSLSARAAPRFTSTSAGVSRACTRKQKEDFRCFGLNASSTQRTGMRQLGR